MKKRTLEKDMMSSQQLGLITFKNVIAALIDNAIDFQVITKETDSYIVKEIDRFGYLMLDDNVICDRIRFQMNNNCETMIEFYDIDDYLEREDCFKGFEIILNAISEAVKEREAV